MLGLYESIVYQRKKILNRINTNQSWDKKKMRNEIEAERLREKMLMLMMRYHGSSSSN